MLSTLPAPLTDQSNAAESLDTRDHVVDDPAGGQDDIQLAEAPGERLITSGDDAPVALRDVDEDAPDALTPPDLQHTETLAARLQTLLATVLEVEQLSRQAREAAASDLAHYDALVVARQLLEQHHREAVGIRYRAEELAASAFGARARAAAALTIAEARALEHMLNELIDRRTSEATAFKADHADVEALVDERRQHAAEARRRQVEAERAQRLADLVQTGEVTLRQSGLAEARDCLRRLEAEFPAEEHHIQALRTRIQQRLQADRDAAARAALAQAAEHQGRGDLEGALAVLEQVGVRGLSVEVGEDVFGAWSQACSRLAQSAGFDQVSAGSLHEMLVRFAPAKGRGLVLMRDPAVPHGLIVFSSLGMGPGYPRDRIVSDRLIVERARGFRRAAPLAEAGGRRSYASWPSSATVPAMPGVERH
jgi:hypothetical protein